MVYIEPQGQFCSCYTSHTVAYTLDLHILHLGESEYTARGRIWLPEHPPRNQVDKPKVPDNYFCGIKLDYWEIRDGI